MRVVLAAAPTPGFRYRQAENLGLRYLVSGSRAAGHDVCLSESTDRDITIPQFVDELRSYAPDLVGFAVQFANQAEPTMRAATLLRRAERKTAIIAGGQALNFAWEDMLERCHAVDAVACFEADDTIVDYLSWLAQSQTGDPPTGLYVRASSGHHFTGYRQPIDDLDALPFPARDQASRVYDQPNFVMLSSRGCQSHCTFCSSGFFGNRYHRSPRWRARSSQNVLAELNALVQQHEAKAISFVDDDYLGGRASDAAGRARAVQIAQGIIDSPYAIAYSIELRADELLAATDEIATMRRSGLKHVLIGLDGLTRPDLKLYSKQVDIETQIRAVEATRTHDLSAAFGVILLNPLTTISRLSDALATLERMHICKSDHLTNKLQLYRGSPLIRYLDKEGARLRWSPTSFKYEYDLSPEVGAIHEQFKLLAAAVSPSEVVVARAKFHTESRIGQQPSSDARTARAIRLQLLGYERTMSDLLCSWAYDIATCGAQTADVSGAKEQFEALAARAADLVPIATTR